MQQPADTYVEVDEVEPNDILKQRAALLTVIHEKAMSVSKRANELMVTKHAAKNPPCVYSTGEEVLVKLKSKKWNKVKGKGLAVPPSYKCKVLDSRPSTHQYKVLVHVDGQDKEEWVSVAQISSLTRAEDKLREKSDSGIECDELYESQYGMHALINKWHIQRVSQIQSQDVSIHIN